MREKLKLILSKTSVITSVLLFAFLSLLNICHGLSFSVAEHPETSTFLVQKTEITPVSQVENKVNATVASVKTQSTSVSKTTTSRRSGGNSSNSSSCLNYTSVGSISIGGRNINIINGCIDGNNQLETPNSGAAVYNTRFIYGHNSNDTFGFLKNLSVGTEFSVTLNGVTKRYKIARKDTLSRDTFINKDVRRKIYTASYEGSYALAIMTCAGTSYGNGDASHRLIIQATRI